MNADDIKDIPGHGQEATSASETGVVEREPGGEEERNSTDEQADQERSVTLHRSTSSSAAPSTTSLDSHDSFSIASLMANIKRRSSAPSTSEQGTSMSAHLAVYAQRQADLQERLKSLTASLKNFDQREREREREREGERERERERAPGFSLFFRLNCPASRAKEARAETERVRKEAAAAAADRMKQLLAKKKKPCHLDELTQDLVLKIFHLLQGRSLYNAFAASKRFEMVHQDVEFWRALIAREQQEVVDERMSLRELKEFYVDNTQKWNRIMQTYKWLVSKGCPSDVNGTQTGPWSRRTITLVLQDSIKFSMPPAPAWRKLRILADIRCICAFLSSSNENIQELAASAIGNVMVCAGKEEDEERSGEEKRGGESRVEQRRGGEGRGEAGIGRKGRGEEGGDDVRFHKRMGGRFSSGRMLARHYRRCYYLVLSASKNR
eukprot:767027-Hanusia_phi.AAC.2